MAEAREKGAFVRHELQVEKSFWRAQYKTVNT